MKNSWLFILVFMILGTEVILLYSAKNIIDKADEDNPSIQQKVIQSILSAPTSKAGASTPRQSFTDDIVDPGHNEINFDFIMSDLKPGVTDILNPNMFFLKLPPDFKILIKQNPAGKDTREKYLTRGDRKNRTDHNYLTEQGIEKERPSSISYGKEGILDPGHYEETAIKNRRAHFVVMNK